jgi:16S rRNA U1498 N3-methylase RsmE
MLRPFLRARGAAGASAGAASAPRRSLLRCASSRGWASLPRL